MTHEPAERAAAPSLRKRLTVLLLLAVLATAVVQGVLTWRSARLETEALFDAQMQRTALSLTRGLAPLALDDEAPEGPAEARDLIIQIWRIDGAMLYRSPSARLLPPQSTVGFSRVRADRETYRVYTLPTVLQVVQVAQRESTRRAAATRLAVQAVLPVALLAPILMVLLWWVVGRTLAPTVHLRKLLAGRGADELTPLPTEGLPIELLPLVEEMNGLLVRLAGAWQALSDFTADAAHELRSPLAALRLQVQSLQRAQDAQGRAVATARLLSGVDRATHLVEQLLALARQQGVPDGQSFHTVDLCGLASDAVAEIRPEAQTRAIAVALETPAVAEVGGQPEALHLAVVNLLQNALRYTPDGDRIKVTVRAAGASLGPSIAVEDSGRGIALAERARVLDRFYRAPDASGQGSGLGLAIVKAVADRHGAQVSIGESASLGGARLAIEWPAAPPAPSAVRP